MVRKYSKEEDGFVVTLKYNVKDNIPRFHGEIGKIIPNEEKLILVEEERTGEQIDQDIDKDMEEKKKEYKELLFALKLEWKESEDLDFDYCTLEDKSLKDKLLSLMANDLDVDDYLLSCENYKADRPVKVMISGVFEDYKKKSSGEEYVIEINKGDILLHKMNNGVVRTKEVDIKGMTEFRELELEKL